MDRQEQQCAALRVPKCVAVRRTVLIGKKEVCRASSLEWAKRISKALNHEHEKESQ